MGYPGYMIPIELHMTRPRTVDFIEAATGFLQQMRKKRHLAPDKEYESVLHELVAWFDFSYDIDEGGLYISEIHATEFNVTWCDAFWQLVVAHCKDGAVIDGYGEYCGHNFWRWCNEQGELVTYHGKIVYEKEDIIKDERNNSSDGPQAE